MPSITRAIARRTRAAAQRQFELRQRRRELVPVIEQSANQLIAAIRALKEVEALIEDNRQRLVVAASRQKEDAELDAELELEMNNLTTLAINMEDVFYRSDPALWRGLLEVGEIPVIEKAATRLGRSDRQRVVDIKEALERAIEKIDSDEGTVDGE